MICNLLILESIVFIFNIYSFQLIQIFKTLIILAKIAGYLKKPKKAVFI